MERIICGDDEDLGRAIDQHFNPLKPDEEIGTKKDRKVRVVVIGRSEPTSKPILGSFTSRSGLTDSRTILDRDLRAKESAISRNTFSRYKEEKEAHDNKCHVCKKETTLTCGRCMSIYYCSKEHQKEHWKIHRFYCTK
jgi:hypothetical protein